jgi:hypothetical protein
VGRIPLKYFSLLELTGVLCYVGVALDGYIGQLDPILHVHIQYIKFNLISIFFLLRMLAPEVFRTTAQDAIIYY